jgi:hypothetical protein
VRDAASKYESVPCCIGSRDVEQRHEAGRSAPPEGHSARGQPSEQHRVGDHEREHDRVIADRAGAKGAHHHRVEEVRDRPVQSDDDGAQCGVTNTRQGAWRELQIEIEKVLRAERRGERGPEQEETEQGARGESEEGDPLGPSSCQVA